VWFGTMVGSALNSNAAAQLLPLCVACDLDGAFLVTDESQWFDGGFAWGRSGIELGAAPGAGVRIKIAL
jgi:hypothetical protein